MDEWDELGVIREWDAMHALEPTDASLPVEVLDVLQVRGSMRATGERRAIGVSEAFTTNTSQTRLASFVGNGGVTTAGCMTSVASESSEALFAGNSGMGLAGNAAVPLAGAACTGGLLRSCPRNQVCCLGCIFEDFAYTTETSKSAAWTEKSRSE